jgi:hypothetical protein
MQWLLPAQEAEESPSSRRGEDLGENCPAGSRWCRPTSLCRLNEAAPYLVNRVELPGAYLISTDMLVLRVSIHASFASYGCPKLRVGTDISLLLEWTPRTDGDEP